MKKNEARLVDDVSGYAELFDSGSCVGYSEVFDDEGAEDFRFEFEGKTWLVDDQYCMNPACLCNETILTFIDYVPSMASLKPSFVIRLSVDSGGYSHPAEYDMPPYPGMDRIIGCFMGGDPKHRLAGLKNRYRLMKARGRELAAERQLAQERRVGAVPGRNDSCPCGSGKKYKKCCGR